MWLAVSISGQASPPKATVIEHLIHEMGYDRPDGPGLAVAVFQDGKFAYEGAFGLADVETGSKNGVETNFRLASVSKQFTAAGVLILAERGKLSLNDRLSKFFPGFPSYGSDVTVQELLHQTSGIPDYDGYIPKARKAQLNDADVLDILEGLRHGDFPPGERFEYSNSNYVLLGLIIENASGQSFPDFLNENVFVKLGMKKTIAAEPGTVIPHRAFGFSPHGDGFEKTDQSLTSATRGDGCIYSSVRDLFRWDQALYGGSVLGRRLFSKAFEPGRLNNGQMTGYGDGWFLAHPAGFEVIFHTGSSIGFRNAFLRLPQNRLTVAVLMNRSDGKPLELANRIARIYLPTFPCVKAD